MKALFYDARAYLRVLPFLPLTLLPAQLCARIGRIAWVDRVLDRATIDSERAAKLRA